MKKLCDLDDEKEHLLYADKEKLSAELVKEAMSVYMSAKKQGEYTIEDYYAFPNEERMELIDGVIYDMGAPLSIHQLVVGEIYFQLKSKIRMNKGQCKTLMSPIDVQVEKDDKTMVQPDVMVVCEREKIVKRGIYGAPDFVVEVLSPFTRKKDVTVKLALYQRANIREYWIVDPDKKRVYVYEFGKDDLPVMYTFENKVPVAIFDGLVVVDFTEINEEILFLDESKEGIM